MAPYRPKTAELHLHFGDERTRYPRGKAPVVINHGIPTRALKDTANAVLASGVSYVANTEHNAITENTWNLHDMIMGQLALENLDRRGARRTVTPLMGAELSLRHEGEKYHVGVVFEGWCDQARAPALPEARSELVPALEQLRKEASCVLILNHPYTNAADHWNNSRERPTAEQKTHELIGSGLFDGIEVLNGTGFFHLPEGMVSHYLTARALRSVEFWRKRGVTLSTIGASDAHAVSTIGVALTRAEGVNRRSFLESIRSGGGEALPRHPNVVRGFEGAKENIYGLSVWDHHPKVLERRSYSSRVA